MVRAHVGPQTKKTFSLITKSLFCLCLNRGLFWSILSCKSIAKHILYLIHLSSSESFFHKPYKLPMLFLIIDDYKSTRKFTRAFQF